MAAGKNGASVDNQPGIVGPRQGHGKTGPVLVAMMHPDDGIVAMGGADHLCPVGNVVARRQGGIAAFVPLHDIVAHGGNAEGESDQAGCFTSFANEGCQFVSVHVTKVSVEQGSADADLGLAKILRGEPQSPIKCVDTPLPARGERAGIPVHGGVRGTRGHV